MAIYKSDIVTIDLDNGNIYRSFLNKSIGKNDDMANRFGVRVTRSGSTVGLGGVSAQGYFIAPDGQNIAITGSDYTGKSGNVAWVQLPQACYNVEGQFCLSIKLIGGGITGTMRIVDGVVDNTGASGAVAPTGSIPSYQEVLAVYDAAIEAVDNLESLEYKNLITPFYRGGQDYQRYGITFLKNADGSVIMFGTATEDAIYYFTSHTQHMTLPKGEYTLSGCQGGSTSTYYQYIKTELDADAPIKNTDGMFTFELDNDLENYIHAIIVKSGTTVTNVVIYPMLEKGVVAHDYIPPEYEPTYILNNNQYGSSDNILPPNYARINGYKRYGIVFKINEDMSVTADGTADDGDSYFGLVMENDTLKPGKYTFYNASHNMDSKAVMSLVINGDSHIATTGEPVTFTVENEATYNAYIIILQGETVDNEVVCPMLVNGIAKYEYRSPKESTKNLLRAEQGAKKISVISYNIGHYNFGTTPHSLVPETAERYIEGMKNFFMKYHPDILFLQEYLKQLIQGQPSSDADITIFNPLYKYETNETGTWNTIRSIHEMTKLRVSRILPVDPYANSKPYRYAQIEVNGHSVAICDVHLLALLPQSGSEFDTLPEARAYELEHLLELFDGDDYGILCGDFNCTSEAERDSMVATVRSKGFQPINGGYMGWKTTHPYDNPVNYFDNIFIKGDIVLCKSSVLYDETENLPSDHIPVYAEFAVY